MSPLFAKWYDFFMSPLEKRKFQKIRKKLLTKASGKVLELGSGTGINFPLYEALDQVVAIEPNPYMAERSLPKQKESVVPIKMVQASAEELPFETNTFDTAVATLVFCTIPNVEKAIQEIKRVCKPGAKILLFEHVKMENQYLSQLQEWLTPAWKKVCDGCCLNRDTISIVQTHGIPIIQMQKYYHGLFISAEAVNEK